MHVCIENAEGGAGAGGTVVVRRYRLGETADQSLVGEFRLLTGERGMVEVGPLYVVTVEESADGR